MIDEEVLKKRIAEIVHGASEDELMELTTRKIKKQLEDEGGGEEVPRAFVNKNVDDELEKRTLFAVLSDTDSDVVLEYIARRIVSDIVPAQGKKRRQFDISASIQALKETFPVMANNITAQKTREALLTLEQMGAVRVVSDEHFVTPPRATRKEFYKIERVSDVHFLAVCDYAEMPPEPTVYSTEEDSEALALAVRTFREQHFGKHAVVGYPQPEVDTFDHVLYPLEDQQCRIVEIF